MAIQVVKLNVTGARGPVGPTGPTGGSGNSVASKSALKAIDASNGDSWLLGASGIYGTFTWRTGDYSAQVASDPREGLYIVSTVAGKGATVGCWVRQWDEVNGRPEWFGAQVNNSGFDCLAALMDCVALCPVTLLRSADYWISGRWNIATAYRTIVSEVVSDGFNTGHGARIISTNKAQDACRVGPTTTPTDSNGCLRNVTIRGVTFMHDAVPNFPAEGSEDSAIAALRCEYLIHASIADNCAQNPVAGFVFYGVIASHIVGNRAFRAAKVDSVLDLFIGFMTAGPAATALGVIGNNASLYTNRNNASVAGPALAITAGRRIGFRHVGDISDQFHTDFEGLACGVQIIGNGETNTGVGNSDFRYISPVIDQYEGTAYDVQNIARNGCIRFYDIYSGSPANMLFAMHLQNIGGTVIVSGGDMYATPDNNSIAIGYISSTGTLKVSGVAMHNFARPIGIVDSKHFDISAEISNHDNTPISGTYPAVGLLNSQIGRINVSVVGKANSYAQGVVTFDALCDKIVIDPTLIDPACIQSGAANKVVLNSSVQITAPGNYTSAGSSGTAGNGILVHGITS